MSLKTKGTRIGAVLLALLFLATSVGFSIAVIWQINKDKKSSTVDNQQLTQKEAQLKGTKLTNFTPSQKVDKLESIDLQTGSGEEVKPGATVTAHYTGAIASTGIIFESSLDSGQPATFPLSGVIKGWTDGVPGMKVGGKRRLIIPSSMAYGEAGRLPKIGPNEALVFDIELTAVQNP